jgi:hypothetical protein
MKLAFFNHAHIDFIEVAAYIGLPGRLLLLTTLCW